MSNEELFSEPLTVDEAELTAAAEERGTTVDLSDDLRLLARRNHLRLLKKDAYRQEIDGDRWRAHTLLVFQSAADVSCRFLWVSLTVRMADGSDAVVTDIDPKKGDLQNVKYARKLSPALEAQVPGLSVKATLGGERTTEYSVAYPLLVGSNFEDWANWTFRTATPDDELVLDHPLILTTEFPARHADGLEASIEVHARVAFRDWRQIVPLLGRRTASSGQRVYLDR